MQTDIRNRTNLIRLADCFTWGLQQIKANSPYPGPATPNSFFLSDGVVVDRSGDRRVSTEEGTDKQQEYRAKGSLVTLFIGDQTLEDSNQMGHRGTLGGNRRKQQVIDFIVTQTLSTEQIRAQITPDMIADWLRMDLEWGICYRQQFIQTAALALHAQDNTWGVGPTWLNPRVTMFKRNPLIRWPHISWVLRLVGQIDETAPLGGAGVVLRQ